MRNKVLRCERIRNLCIDRNLSQREVAVLLNARQNTYSQYEIEVLNHPIDVLVRLVYYYSTSVDYLPGFTDEQISYSRAKSQDF